MADLRGHLALVTGASSGLGHRFAQVLAAHGAKVAVAARRADRLSALVETVEAKNGVACAFAFDARDGAAPDALMEEVAEAMGVPTLLINSAGIHRPGKAHRNTAEDFDDTMAVNLRTPWRLSQLCAARWIAAGTQGAIVNVASMLAFRVGAGVSTYATSKAALQHMTASHALEWARHGVRVNALCPGYIRTEINEAFWETEQGQAELKRLPRRRIGDPEALDTALLFLTDPRSHFVNGASIVVDDAQSWAI